MPNLITAWDRKGKLATCDESCYNAKGATCNCICGGRFHGLGLKRALERLPHQKAELEKKLAPNYYDIVFPFRLTQLWLLPQDSGPSLDST